MHSENNRVKCYTAKLRTQEMRKLVPIIAIAVACVIAAIALGVFAGLGAWPLILVPLVMVPVGGLAICLMILGIKGFEAKNLIYKKKHIVELNTEKLRGKEIALFIEANFDHNGALKAAAPRKLCKQYPLATRQVSSVQDIKQIFNKLRELDCKIKVLWISAHGNWDHIRLGKRNGEVLHLYNAEALRGSFAGLAEDAPIVLAACSTAEGDSNIAQAIAHAAPRHKVFASKRDLFAGNLKLKSVEPLQIKMNGPRWGWQGENLFQKIAAVFCLCMAYMPSPISRHFKQDLLKVYQTV